LSWTTLTFCSATPLSIFSASFSIFWIYYSPNHALMIDQYCFRYTSMIGHKWTGLMLHNWCIICGTVTALFCLPHVCFYSLFAALYSNSFLMAPIFEKLNATNL
jgi:hypothetical protein